MAQVTPAFFRYWTPNFLAASVMRSHARVAFSVAHALHLIESGYRVSDMTCVDQRLFPLCGEGELVVVQLVLLSGVQSARTF